MRIMVTNDDGIDMEGMHVLARAMREHGDVVIIAPEAEQSGMGAALGPLHLIRPEVQRREVPGIDESWSVSGTPALCVFFARLGVFGEPFDMVVSGINPGANVGRAVYHSGTVGAGFTARNGGIAAVAVSQETSMFETLGQGEATSHQHWDSAAAVASAVVGGMNAEGLDPDIVVNINVPNKPIDELSVWRHAEVGTVPPSSVSTASLQPMPHRTGRFTVEMEWGPLGELPVELDGGAVSAGEVTISTLSRVSNTGSVAPGIVASLESLTGLSPAV